jgi:hypothetical protein
MSFSCAIKIDHVGVLIGGAKGAMTGATESLDGRTIFTRELNLVWLSICVCS